jgi:glutaredoxin-like protein
MALLKDEDRHKLVEEFGQKLASPVKLAFFTQNLDCMYCGPTEMILKELAPLSDKIALETWNFVNDKTQAELYGIDKIPAVAVIGAKDHGVRFYGIPAGYEFASLVASIIDVSRGETGLSQESKDVLMSLSKPVNIQVFVTPTCPYCQSMVRLAHQAAVESDLVTAHMVESTEFPHLAQRYGVMGVPKTVINETASLDGAVPEHVFMHHLQEAGKQL